MSEYFKPDFPDARQIARWRTMTPAQKYESAMQLVEFARRFQAAAIQTQHPDWTEAQTKAEVRRRWLHVLA